MKIRIAQWLISTALSLMLTSQSQAVILANEPLFLSESAAPLMMLTMSKDHQLFAKAFDDYSDINGDGTVDTTYDHSIDYYGYFDSYKCYEYSTANGQFVPKGYTSTKYCSSTALKGKWSGNFLNWATMTRIDVLRKILYGGKRVQPEGDNVVLERAHLPTDSHSFVKYYNGSRIDELTPYDVDGSSSTDGLTICNTSYATSGHSHDTTAPPVMRIARGAWLLWNAQEAADARACSWTSEAQNTPNATNQTTVASNSGLTVLGGIPSTTTTNANEFIVRVSVCDKTLMSSSSSELTQLGTMGKDNEENCKLYGNSTTYLRPTGLMHNYGEAGNMRFGLMTGSYGKNLAGGVLRKNIENFSNEIDATTGKINTATQGIIKTIDAFRIYGYSYSGKNYNSDSCYTGDTNPAWIDKDGNVIDINGTCTSWGNPQAELFLEALRYIAKKPVNSSFNANDSSKFSALQPVTWQDSMAQGEYCSALSILQFNASTVSFDGDNLSTASDLGISNLDLLTDTIGTSENITGNNYFVGANNVTKNLICTGKRIDNLSKAFGICPEEPRLQGSYQLSGLAFYAHTNDLRTETDKKGIQSVKTYGVSLATSVPKIEVKANGKAVTILPACYNTTNNREPEEDETEDDINREGNCGLVDFRVVSATPTQGKYVVLWETNDKGADYDMDLWGTLEYRVDGNNVTVTTDTLLESTGACMLFGYVISGTDKDGFHAHSGNTGECDRGSGKHPDLDPNNSGYDKTGVRACYDLSSNTTTNICDKDAAASSQLYTASGIQAGILKPPLYYAAKWGGFNDKVVTNGNTTTGAGTIQEQSEWDADNDGLPDTYFYASNPAKLSNSLNQAFKVIYDDNDQSSSAIATNSTRLDTGVYIYQAIFLPKYWSGELKALPLNAQSGAVESAVWSTSDANKIPAYSARNILTSKLANTTAQGANFLWAEITSDQKTVIKDGDSDTVGQQRLNWLRGDATNEGTLFRDRPEKAGVNLVLGDIINSDPVYVGKDDDYGLAVLQTGSSGLEPSNTTSYKDYLASKKNDLIFIGANDGMLHGFKAGTVTTTGTGINTVTTVTGGGEEIFAYVPYSVFNNLPSLSSPDYTHQYYVDGTVTVSDACLKATDSATTCQWRTILVGSTGAGGNSVFAIDITDAITADSINTANAASLIGAGKVLWEYTTTGATISQPKIGRMADGSWAAIYTTGYPGSYGASQYDQLIIRDLRTGAETKVISTKKQSGGLGTPALIPNATSRVIETIYAGDMQGNLWKFNVSNTSTSSWSVAFGNTATPEPLFTTASNRPITAPLEVGRNPSGGYMIYFGTGQYFASGDNIVGTSPPTDRFYGIRDDGNQVTTSKLVAQTITLDTATGARKVSSNAVDYDASGNNKKYGWYVDLPTAGERVVSRATLRFGRIIFPTVIPNRVACEGGGTSWLMEMEAVSGKQLEVRVFDMNGDGKINNSDTIVAGIKLGDGLIKNPAIIGGGDREYKYFSTTSGSIKKVDESTSANSMLGRQSWRQLK